MFTYFSKNYKLFKITDGKIFIKNKLAIFGNFTHIFFQHMIAKEKKNI